MNIQCFDEPRIPSYLNRRIVCLNIALAKYRIVASRNTCYYSENYNFCFLKPRILTCLIFFLGTKLFCLSLDLLDITAT